MKDKNINQDWYRQHIGVSSKKHLEDALIEIKFAVLKGADLKETQNLIEWLLKGCANFYFEFM